MPKAVTIYTSEADACGRYLAEQGMPGSPAYIRREHFEAYITSLRERGLSPSTVHQHSRSISLSFAWLAEEGEVRALIKARQKGISQFENRRDEAIIRLSADTRMRLGELVGLTLDADRRSSAPGCRSLVTRP